MPAVTPQVLVLLLFRTVDACLIFDTIYVLTKGGPGYASMSVGLYSYLQGFT